MNFMPSIIMLWLSFIIDLDNVYYAWVFSPLLCFVLLKAWSDSQRKKEKKSLDMDEKCINNVGFISSEVCKRANRNLVYASGNKRKKIENDAENVACFRV
jgi:hypothetical protein